MKHIYRTLTLCVLPLLVAACNTDYNFDNISLEVTVGNTDGIIVPLGTTGEIKVGDLLADAGLGTNPDGFYGVAYGDSFEYSVELGNIAPITGLVPTIDPIESQLLGSLSASIPPFSAGTSIAFPAGLSGGMQLTDAIIALLPTKTLTLEQEPSVFENEFQVALPEQVASLKEIVFGDNGEGSTIQLTFDLGGLAGVCSSCTIDRFNIELPAGFTLAKNENSDISRYTTISKGTGSATPNHFQIAGYPLSGAKLVVDIIIKSVDMSSATIGANSTVTINQNVTYDLLVNGNLKAGSITATAPSVSILAQDLEIYEASIIAGDLAIDVDFSESISESISIPTEVARIDYLEIAKAGTNGSESPKFAVSVELEGAPMNAVTLSNVEISLPSFLDIDTPEGWNYANGKLTVPSLTLHNNQNNSLIDLAINGIKSLPIAEGTLTLDSTIGLSATAGVVAGSEVSINTSAQSLKLTPRVVLDDIEIVKVTGLIDPDLSDLLAPQVIELGDFASSLGDFDIELNIASPVIRLTVENPIGVGINAGLSIKAYKGSEVVSTLTTPTLTIQPAGNTPTTTHIIINGDAAPDSPEYQLVQLEGFADMIAALPEKIEVVLSAETNKDFAHHLALQDSYTFKVEYSVDAAFKFDPNKSGEINYSVLIEDMDLSALADIDLMVESLTVKVASESTLPIDLSLDIAFLDESGEPIECITSSTTGVVAGSTTTEPKLSECDINLQIAQQGTESSTLSSFAQIARTKSVRCDLKGTTLAGGGLRPEQYLSAKLSLLLDKGITIDLGSLLSEGADEE